MLFRSINGTQNIFYEKEGKLYQSEKRFLSKEKLEDVIQQIVAGSNRLVNEASPIVDARLADGSRVNVILAPIALNGPVVTIRKFPKEAVTMRQLITWNSISKEVAKILAVFAVMLLIGSWMLDKMSGYMVKLWSDFSLYV